MTSDERRRLREHVAASIAEEGWQYADWIGDTNAAGAGDEEDNGADGFDAGNGVYNQ